MSFDALGRQTSQSNGLATSTFSFNASNLQIDTETITYTLPDKPAFTRVIDRSQDSLSRESGWQLKAGATVENSVAYDYSATDGRLETVSGGDLWSPFSYSYLPNSNLIASLTGPAHTVTNLWESTRNVLSSKQNKVGATNISSYNYGVNSIGQRTNVAKTGTAFAGVLDITWGYNSKGEVVKADHTLPGLDRAYVFDGIGNRLKSADSLTLPVSNNYSVNALNQYTSVNSVIPVHDADGNMTSGPLPANINANSTLIWDGENRLIEAQVNSGNTVTFIYDSQSRRIAETVGAITTVYLFDGWNPIAEYSTTYALTKTYTWGIDLSGSLQGAGGVGGLLAVTDSTGTYFPTFDGNGNVSEYLDSTGAVSAHYEYDPFGKTTVATGPKANDFAHRFSTKPLDAATGLYYYGYRYYDPNTGRWPSRDPIEEEGGINLYGFVGNDAVSRLDRLGLEFTGTYTISTGKLSLTDNDRKKKWTRNSPITCECEGSSGNNDADDIDVKGEGPLPTGDYVVFDRGEGFFRYVLDPVDTKIHNDQWDGRDDGITRNAFRIHLEGKGDNRGSDGCIVTNEDDLTAMARFIQGTKKGPVVRIKQEPNVVNPIEFDATRVGTISVIE